MKTIITIVLVLVIGSTVGYLAMQHYDNYQKTSRTDANVQQLAKDGETTNKINAITAERDGARQQTEAMRAECQKGAKAYFTLTTTQKRNIEAPDCGEVEPVTE